MSIINAGTAKTYGLNKTAGANQAAMQAVAYASSSDAPSAATRTASFVLTDPEANASAAKIVTLFVTPVNDAPTVGGSTLTRSVVNGNTYNISTATTGNAILLAAGSPTVAGLIKAGCSDRRAELRR